MCLTTRVRLFDNIAFDYLFENIPFAIGLCKKSTFSILTFANFFNLKCFILWTNFELCGKTFFKNIYLTRLASLLRFAKAKEQNDGPKLPWKFYV